MLSIATEKPKEAMQDIKKGMGSILKDLPDEFGGYLLTGALCYEVNPCKMSVFATVSLLKEKN